MKMGMMAGLFLLPMVCMGAVTNVFTVDTDIQSTNRLYDDSIVVVDGCSLTVDGVHAFVSLTLTNGAVLTHSACTTSLVYSMEVALSDDLFVSSDSKIDVTGLGYLPGYTAGNVTNGASTGTSGGSHGGLGYERSGQSSGDVYGDFRDPQYPGSGGGWPGTSCSAGGGLVRLVVGNEAVINGAIRADGADIQTGSNTGGGAGGGIYLTAGILSGSGCISANGGTDSDWHSGRYSADGGGGRVAVFYETDNGFLRETNVTALSAGGVDLMSAAGTVYLKQAGRAGLLRVCSGTNYTGMYTPLGTATDTVVSVEQLVVSGVGVTVQGHHGIPFAVDGLVVTNGAVMTHPACTTNATYNLTVTVNSNLHVASGASLDVTGRGYLPGYTVGNVTNGATKGKSGGSYGGYGYQRDTTQAVNEVYGDFRDPAHPGSGGGDVSGCSAGGGLIRVTVGGTATIDGEIKADGGDVDTGTNTGGGSGGGICLNAVALAGLGSIHANGGTDSDWHDGRYSADGGGGRVAVYYGTENGFLNGTNVTAYQAGGVDLRASAGTVYLQQTGQVGRLLVDGGTGHAPDGYTPLGTADDSDALYVGDLICGGTGAVVCPHHEFAVHANNVLVTNGAQLSHRSTDASQVFSLDLRVSNDVTVVAGASIDVSARGYMKGYWKGNTTLGASVGRAGGSYGGMASAWGTEKPNAVYGDARNPLYPGAGSGVYLSYGDAGGGLIRLSAGGTLRVDGSLVADGGYKGNYNDPGGAGGGICLNVCALEGSGVIGADGGAGNNGSCGGAGGRIAVYASDANDFVRTNITVAEGRFAETGSIHVAETGTVYFALEEPATNMLHGNYTMRWRIYGVHDAGYTVDASLQSEGTSLSLASGASVYDACELNTLLVNNGWYTLQMVLRNASGVEVNTDNRTVLINNSVTWHSGDVLSDEVWSNGTVHVLESDVTVLSNVTLTVQAGTVVKALPGVKMSVYGELVATGTASRTVIFTAITDDTASGDTNLDGSQTIPVAGFWRGVNAEGGGTLTMNDDSQIRYALREVDGALSGSQTWKSTYLYSLTDTVTVSNGVTLTIEPGAVIKVASGKGIEIQAGGLLKAEGSVAQPIVITSLKDDSVGGDLNGDGSATSPAAGDWKWISLQTGATGSLFHCVIRYGGNVGNDRGMIDSYGRLSMKACWLEESLYDGIESLGGSAVVRSCVILNCDRGAVTRGGVLTVVNCTLYKNRIGIVPHGGSSYWYNNVVAESIDASTQFNEGIQAFAYNNLWPDPYQAGVNGNISTNPAFVDATGGNYRLDYGSPCIDAADTPDACQKDYMDIGRVNDPRTLVKHGVAGADGVYADMGAYEFVANAPSDVDLIAVDVAGPGFAAAEDRVLVEWSIRNIGSATISNSWHDEIRLVPVNPVRWDSVLVVTQVLSSATLGPGQSASFSALVHVPGATEGNWRWQVKANASGSVYEGENWKNNAGDASAVMPLSVPEIAMGSATSSVFAGDGKSVCYKVQPSAETALKITLDTAADGFAGIYAGYDAMPVKDGYDKQKLLVGDNQCFLFVPPANAARTVYLRVFPEQIGAVGFTVTVEEVAFDLFSLDVTSGGNVGSVTIPVHGSKFLSNIELKLDPVGGGTKIVGTDVQVIDGETAIAAFDLRGAKVGLYDLVARQGSEILALSSAFSVVSGIGGRLDVRVLMPKEARAGRKFTGQVWYKNIGDCDVIAPLMVLNATSKKTSIWSEKGSGSGKTQLSFMGVVPDNSLYNVIPPGASYAVTFYVVAAAGADSADCRISHINADDDEVKNYAALRDTIKPADADEAWSNAWNLVVQECGSTKGSYVTKLGEVSKDAAQEGKEIISEQGLLNYLIAQRMEDVKSISVSGQLCSGSATNAMKGNTVMRLEPVYNPGSTGQLFQTTTRYDGTFVFSAVSNGRYHVLVPGYETVSQTVMTVSGWARTGVVIVVAGKASGLSGFVYDGPQGCPVKSAVLTVKDQLYGSVMSVGTDEQGYYSFSGLSNLPYSVDCVADGWMPVSQRTIDLSSNASCRQDFYLESSGGSITGIVTDAALSGINMAIIKVTMEDAKVNGYGAWSSTVNTDSNGCYVVRSLPLGRYTVFAGARGHAGTYVHVAIEQLAGVSNVNVTLGEGYTVTGLVTDAATGSPISGAKIHCAPVSLPGESWTSDGTGMFVASNRPAGWIQFSADKDGYMTATATGTVGGATGPVHLVMAESGRISGQVTLNGHAASGVLLTLVDQDSPQMAYVRTDVHGNYGVNDMPTGRYSIAVGDVTALSRARFDFEVSASNAVVSHDIALQASACYGAVLDATGGVCTVDTSVALFKGTNMLEQRVTGSGSYFFAVYETGTYYVSASHTGAVFTSVSVAVTNAGQFCKNDLQQGERQLMLTVTQEGFPVTNAQVNLMGTNIGFGMGRVSRYCSTNGVYTFEGLPEGEYRAEAFSASCAMTQMNVSVTQPLVVTNIAVYSGGRLEGVVTVDGVVCDRAMICAQSSDGAETFKAVTGTNGTYRFAALPSDVYQVSCSTYGSRVPSNMVVDLTIARSAIWSIDLTEETTASVSGVVCDSASNRVTGATISMVSTGGMVWCYAVTDNRGEFEITGWPSGEADVMAACAGCLPVSLRLTNNVAASVTGVVLQVAGPFSGTEGITNIEPFAVGFTRGVSRGTKGVPPIVPPWMNWLSGSGSLTPPRSVWDTYGVDDTMDAAVDLMTEMVAAHMDCDEAWDAYYDLMAAYKMAARTMDDWDSAYDAAMEVDGANVAMVLSQASMVLAQITKCLMSFGSASGATAAEEAFVSKFDFGAGLLTVAAQRIQSGDFGGLKGAFDITLGNILGAISVWETGNVVDFVAGIDKSMAQVLVDTTLSPAQRDKILNSLRQSKTAALNGDFNSVSADMIGKIAGIYAVVDEAYKLYNELMTMESALLELLGRYLDSQDRFLKAVDDFHKASNAFFAAADDCDPEPDEPDDKVDIPDAYGSTHILSSLDPNDKQSSGVGDAGYVALAERVYYTINFENVATASVPAQVVTITDTLVGDLDWSTVELGNIGFNNRDIVVPSDLVSFSTNTTVDTDSNPVRVQASFNRANGTMSWEIKSYDPSTGELPADPYAGFLPPNTNDGCGQGYVSFSVQVSSNLGSAASITNAASIVFDVNAAILTPIITNMMDNAAPSSSIWPKRPRVPSIFEVSWSGSDHGSGISQYDVYVSVNSNNYSLYASTSGSSCICTGAAGTRFDFMIRALDRVGNYEAKSVPDLQTVVGAPLKNDFDGDGRSDIGCYYARDGYWYVYKSTMGLWVTRYGYSGTHPVTGDFDGDTLCDYGVYYPPTGQWIIMRSMEGQWENNFGYTGTVPVTGDFDGDGLCDFGCYYAPEGYWYIYKSRDGLWENRFGYEETVPVTGDFDGDGIADFGCYYAPDGYWYIYKSREGLWVNQFGYSGTLPVTGDFDGDGICDFGCYYPEDGNWFIYKSRDGFWMNNFGYEGTLPVTGDYDGDVIDDFGCYYPPEGYWYIYSSSEGLSLNKFGYSGTVPLGE